MGAPIRINEGKYQPLVAHYYIPPPEGAENLATAFTSEFLKVRSPYAAEMWRLRMSALDPSAQAAAMAAHEANAVDLVGQVREHAKDVMSYKKDLVDTDWKYYDTQVGYNQSVDTASVTANQRDREAELKHTEAMAQLENVTGKDLAPIQGAKDALSNTARDVAQAKAQVGKAMAITDPVARKAAVDAAVEGLGRATSLYTSQRGEIIKTFKKTAEGINQVGALDALLSSELQTQLATVSGGDDPALAPLYAKLDDKIARAWDARRVDQKLLTTAGEQQRTQAAGQGLRGLPARPAGPSEGGVSVGASSSRSGPVGAPVGGAAASPDDAFMDMAGRTLASIEAAKADTTERFYHPYGGFNDPIPGMFGSKDYDPSRRPTREQMASQLTTTMAKQRNLPPPGSSAAADATPPAAAEAARTAAAAEHRPQTMTELVAQDLDGTDSDPYFRGTIAPREGRSAGRKIPTADYIDWIARGGLPETYVPPE